MTLTITLAIAPEAEAQLRESIARHDTERVRQTLLDALTPTVEALLRDVPAPVEQNADWETLATNLIDTFDAASSKVTHVLSPYATTRAGISRQP